MRILTAICLLTILLGCHYQQSKKPALKKSENNKPSNSFIKSAIDARFPLRLEKINLEDNKNTVPLSENIAAKIEETVKQYAKDFEFYDSSQTYKDSYINTIQLYDSLQTIFVILLKHYPTSEVNSKILFYDNLNKKFADKEIEFKIYALYDYENGKLKTGYLKKLFKIEAAEIEQIDYNKDGVKDYKLMRLWHNGTFNAIHTTILTLKNNKIDTLYFDEIPI
jgi:hypothetical protein